MPKKTVTKATSTGICNFCQGEFEKGKMTQHLKYCKQRLIGAKAGSDEKSGEVEKEKLFHLEEEEAAYEAEEEEAEEAEIANLSPIEVANKLNELLSAEFQTNLTEVPLA